MTKKMLSLDQVTKKINEFKQAYPTFKSTELLEYLKLEKIPYKTSMQQALVDFKVITKLQPGIYGWQKEPVHINKVSIILAHCKEQVRVYNQEYVAKKKAENPTKASVSDVINFDELIAGLSKGYSVDDSKANYKLTDEKIIAVLKTFGYKIFKSKEVLEEV